MLLYDCSDDGDENGPLCALAKRMPNLLTLRLHYAKTTRFIRAIAPLRALDIHFSEPPTTDDLRVITTSGSRLRLLSLHSSPIHMPGIPGITATYSEWTESIYIIYMMVRRMPDLEYLSMYLKMFPADVCEFYKCHSGKRFAIMGENKDARGRSMELTNDEFASIMGTHDRYSADGWGYTTS